MKIDCSYCKKEIDKPTGHINRSKSKGSPIYCNKTCAGLGRRSTLTLEEKKKEKADYDKLYRDKNREALKEKARIYNLSEAGRETQKRLRVKRKQNGKHAEYCRKPDQRKKEKHRRHIHLGQLKEKHCIGCDRNKPLIEFECYTVFPDKRLYLCKDCEKIHETELGCTTRGVMTAIVMRSRKMNGMLTRRDIAKYPYLIEANKYLILLKQLVK